MPERITYEWINREIGEAMEKPASRTVLYDLAALFMMRDRLKEGAEKHTARAEKKMLTPEVWKGPTLFDAETAEEWVHQMKDDREMPIEPWTVEEVKPLAMRFGYPTNGEKFDEFYTAIHMVKSDYSAVAEDFDVNIPAFYAALADAWLKDPDAALHGREKLEAYHKYIVMGKK